MSALTRTLRELLPHGVVRRVAARRAARRRRELLDQRQRELRPIISPADGAAQPSRLNMGCGLHREPGWINADADPRADLEVVLHHGEPLPFADERLDVVFSEHFLEHLSFMDGCHFLHESHRILRSGGTFRVSCPDLQAIVRMLEPSDDSWRALARVYESIGDFAEGELSSPERVVNWAFYGHEHKHIWTFRQLEQQLERVGFVGTRRMPFGTSSVEGAAIERRIPEAFYSLIVEATKP
jgi:SAM-dependent methyltransferase